MSQEIKLKRGQRRDGWKNNCPKFKEYYAMIHPDWTNEECIDAARKYCRSINWQCIEFYQKKYPHKSIEECEAMRQTAISNKKINSRDNIQYYQIHYPELTHEEHMKMLKDYTISNNYLNISYYERLYPELTHEEHMKMLNETRKEYVKKLKDVSGENNPMHRSNTTVEKRRKSSPKCVEFYEAKYPELTHEEHMKMLRDHMDKTNTRLRDKINQPKCIEHWIKKGYTEEEARNIIRESQRTFSLEKCIEKYGEELGRMRFDERQKKWITSLMNNFYKYGDGRSPSSQFASNMISNICSTLNIPIPEKEKFMSDKHGNNFAYDFCYDKKIIEFNGDYWHMNPLIYKDTDINKIKNMSAVEVWDKDKIKLDCAISNGYEVLVIWESEYNKSKQDSLNKCIKFLTS